MDLAEAQATILKEELPSSEAALLLNEVTSCHSKDCFGGWPVDVCWVDPIDPEDEFYEELPKTPF